MYTHMTNACKETVTIIETDGANIVIISIKIRIITADIQTNFAPFITRNTSFSLTPSEPSICLLPYIIILAPIITRILNHDNDVVKLPHNDNTAMMSMIIGFTDVHDVSTIFYFF